MITIQILRSFVTGTLTLAACTAAFCQVPPADAPAASAAPTALYVDVHDLGPGNVTVEAVAEAHEKDLAIQHQHDVSFEKYWVDEEAGKVYCLAQAPNAEAVSETHRLAHGLVPDHVYEVTDGIEAPAIGGKRLYFDIHRLGPGNVTAEAVAEAHEKDLATQDDHGVRFLQYWVDEATGTVMCLSEADSADAVNATHAAAHGLLAEEILEVAQGE